MHRLIDYFNPIGPHHILHIPDLNVCFISTPQPLKVISFTSRHFLKINKVSETAAVKIKNKDDCKMSSLHRGDVLLPGAVLLLRLADPGARALHLRRL